MAQLRLAGQQESKTLRGVLVPRRPLREMRWQQALRLAQEWQQRAGRTMALEAQQSDTPSSSAQKRLDQMAQEFLRCGGTRLWG